MELQCYLDFRFSAYMGNIFTLVIKDNENIERGKLSVRKSSMEFYRLLTFEVEDFSSNYRIELYDENFELLWGTQNAISASNTYLFITSHLKQDTTNIKICAYNNELSWAEDINVFYAYSTTPSNYDQILYPTEIYNVEWDLDEGIFIHDYEEYEYPLPTTVTSDGLSVNMIETYDEDTIINEISVEGDADIRKRGEGTILGSLRVFNVQSDIVIRITAAISARNVTWLGSHYTASPKPSTTTSGFTSTLTPTNGYLIKTVTVTGATGSWNGTTLTVSNVTGNVVVTISTQPYIVVRGNITNDNAKIGVSDLSNFAFSVTGSTGYQINGFFVGNEAYLGVADGSKFIKSGSSYIMNGYYAYTPLQPGGIVNISTIPLTKTVVINGDVNATSSTSGVVKQDNVFTINNDNTMEFTITPKTGKRLAEFYPGDVDFIDNIKMRLKDATGNYFYDKYDTNIIADSVHTDYFKNATGSLATLSVGPESGNSNMLCDTIIISIPTETYITWPITKKLTNVTCNNSATSIENGKKYTATFTANGGYTIILKSVKMGGIALNTNVVFNGNVLTIDYVMGKLEIEVIAQSVVTYPIAILRDLSEAKTVYNNLYNIMGGQTNKAPIANELINAGFTINANNTLGGSYMPKQCVRLSDITWNSVNYYRGYIYFKDYYGNDINESVTRVRVGNAIDTNAGDYEYDNTFIGISEIAEGNYYVYITINGTEYRSINSVSCLSDDFESIARFNLSSSPGCLDDCGCEDYTDECDECDECFDDCNSEYCENNECTRECPTDGVCYSWSV